MPDTTQATIRARRAAHTARIWLASHAGQRLRVDLADNLIAATDDLAVACDALQRRLFLLEQELLYADASERDPAERVIRRAGERVKPWRTFATAPSPLHPLTRSPAPLSLATVVERDGILFALTHFADCPDAKQWGKKR